MQIINKIQILVFLVMLFTTISFGQPAENPQTFCNPLNLNYRFMVDAVDARETADPVIVLFKDDYYLFASRAGGYWTSTDLRNWTYIVPTVLDVEGYAPTAVVMRDTMFYTHGWGGGSIHVYKSADPKSGIWIRGPSIPSYGDPNLYYDDDGKLYMYDGLSNSTTSANGNVVELDPYTFEEIGSQVGLFYSNAATHGWERRGDDNLLDEVPWLEGLWMLKKDDKYYLHYAGPGTEFKTYADGIYVADSPMGPYEYAPYSPFSFKPTGFICGAGHGSTFMDKDGHYWHIATMTISINHMFERRVGMYPVAFDQDGQIRCNTDFGDYPQYFPGVKTNPIDENFAGMMLLSHKKYVTASSYISGFEANRAVDEEARTYWAAQTGDPGEWIIVDLGKECNIQALQINFAEHGTIPSEVRGSEVDLYEQYTVHTSNDGLSWDILIDKSQSTEDVPHDYIELAHTVQARYVKLTNVFTPGSGIFAVRGFRVFGNSEQAVFTPADSVEVERDVTDGRDAIIRWSAVDSADGYIVRYGIAADRLYNNYMVYDADSVVIHSLNDGVEYYFDVEAFDNGTDYYRNEGEFRTGQSGDWNDINTWEQHDGEQWIAASNIPDLSDGPITIRDDHTVTVTANDTADQVTIAPSGTLLINTGITLFIENSIGMDLIVDGTLKNSGNLDKDSSATIVFGVGGKYEHLQGSGTIPTAIWGKGSTCELTEYIDGSKPANLNQNFYNFTWNCAGQTSNVDWAWFNNTVGGDITVLNTGSARAYLTSPGAGSPNTITINGGIIIENGQFSSNGSGSTADITVNTYGNIYVTGGNFSVSRGSGPSVTWNLFGDFIMSNATTQNSNPDGATFVFTGSGTSKLTIGQGNTLTALPIEVSSGTTLNADSSILSGSGKFILHDGATLETSHATGIDGIFNLDQSPELSEAAGYSFGGSIAQVTGSMMPETVSDLIIKNSAGVTLTNNVTINGTLELTNDMFSLGGNNLQYGTEGTLKYSNSSVQATRDIEFPAENGPKNLIINGTRDVDLHASRSISGHLQISSGKLDLGTHSLIVDSASSSGSSRFVKTTDGGKLIMHVGASQMLFPVGNSTYAPVWIINDGTPDTISVGSTRNTTAAPFGGRVKHLWSVQEFTDGGGDYTLQFGWTASAEDTDFRTDREGNARLYLLPDTIHVGSGEYTTNFTSIPYTLAREGIERLGEFIIGKFTEFPDAITYEKHNLLDFELSQNYPNPFNPVTTIKYQLPKSTRVTITIYDITGKRIRTLLDADQNAGQHSVFWDATNDQSYPVSSGVYFYQLKTDNYRHEKKMLLLR